MKERIKTSFKLRYKELRVIGIVLAVGIVYYLVTRITHFYIPCVFRLATGYVCPGCGISHLFADLFRLDFYSAMRQNLLIAVLLPVWMIYYVIHFFSLSPLFEWGGKVTDILAWLSVALSLVFGVLRNFPQFEFLYPLYLR